LAFSKKIAILRIIGAVVVVVEDVVIVLVEIANYVKYKLILFQLILLDKITTLFPNLSQLYYWK
jgi:hypothetical protein